MPMQIIDSSKMHRNIQQLNQVRQLNAHDRDDAESTNSKMLDSEDFVLNNTMSSYVMNSHRDDY
jgi:hypothetical protein